MDEDGFDLSDVPMAYRERLLQVTELINDFCDAQLNDEYKAVCRDLTRSLCQEGSPFLKGKAEGWACGIVYAAGWVNFLTDPNQSPHLTAKQIASGFGVSEATMLARHREIRDGLDLMRLDPKFTLASRVDENPLIWILQVNGILMDIRDAPREAQVVAFEQRLIPYIPADDELNGPANSRIF